jgi:hypothetical protein
MFILAEFHRWNFNSQKFLKTLDEAIQLEMRNAARAFLREAIIHVPVRTGFARGALLNMGSAIGLSAASIPTRFLARLRKTIDGRIKSYKPRIVEYYYGAGSKTLKTPENARQFSTPIDKVFLKENNVYLFHYEQTILYYVINDILTNPYTPSAPWRSFEFGKNAFSDYLKNQGIAKLPGARDAITTTLVRVNRSSTSGI